MGTFGLEVFLLTPIVPGIEIGSGTGIGTGTLFGFRTGLGTEESGWLEVGRTTTFILYCAETVLPLNFIDLNLNVSSGP